jgi:hypothetical protein
MAAAAGARRRLVRGGFDSFMFTPYLMEKGASGGGRAGT